MKRRLLFLAMASVFIINMVTGCTKTTGESSSETAGVSGESSSETASVSGDTPTLVVANWKGYGSDEEFAAEAFEELYGCKVVHQYFTSLEEMMTMLQTGGMGKIDVVLPSTVYVDAAKEAGLLETIDTTKLTSYGDLISDYVNLPEAVDDDGNVYAVPWTWGTTSLGYNPEIVTEEVDSWSVLWDDKYAGKVAFFDDYVTAVMTGAIYAGENPSEPDSLDLDKVETALKDLKSNTKLFWASYDDYLNPYKSNEIVIGNMWAGIATSLKNENEPVEFVYPSEGTVGYVDMWCIVKDTKNYDLACKWLDFMIGEDFQYNYATVEGNAHNTVNQKVLDSLTDEQKEVLWSLELPEKIYMQPVLTETQQTEWLEVWNRVKAY